MGMSGEVRGVVMFLGFFVLLYITHSSISSLGEVNFSSGKYKESLSAQQDRYRRALKASENDFGTTYSPETLHLKKCCNVSEMFSDNLTCVKSNAEDQDFPPNRLILDKHFHEVPSQVLENVKLVHSNQTCNDEAFLLTNQSTTNTFIMFETGELSWHGTNYSTNYCIDRTEDQRYVIKTCPCRGHLCIQKCCPSDEYYDTSAAKCAKTSDGGESGPFISFFDENFKEINSTLQYFLVNRPLNCSSGLSKIQKDFEDGRNVFIRADGQLMLKSQEGHAIVNWESYCVDTFSDDNNHPGKLNGFYCEDVNHRRASRDSRKTLNKCCAYGQSLNEFFQCEMIQTNAVKVWKPSPEFLRETHFETFEFSSFAIPDDIVGVSLSVHLKKNDYVLLIKHKRKNKLTIGDIMKTYSNSMFCLDDYQESNSEYALIFWPCQENLCFQKCCPYDSVYNLANYTCSYDPEGSRSIIDLTLLEGKYVQAPWANYFLIYNPYVCDYFRQIYPHTLGADRLFVQPNGTILKRVGKTQTEPFGPRRYCIDLFSEGGISLANGFFCRKGRRTQRDYWPPPVCIPDVRRNKNIASTHFLSARFYVRLIPILLIVRYNIA